MSSRAVNLFIGIISTVLFSFTCCSKAVVSQGVTPLPAVPVITPVRGDVTVYLTSADQTQLLKKQPSLSFSATNAQPVNISVDTASVYQTIDGFGFALTGGSASVINGLPAVQKDALLHELFGVDSGSIGISYLRISIGASDMSSNAFTYDDGPKDNLLQRFSLAVEQTDLIPVLKAIVAINPTIKILGSPWSAPAWMKTNNSLSQGSLDTANYEVYARYFVKYIQAMKAAGIIIDAITPQNEPLNANNNPSMVMQASEEASFVKNNLGPQLRAAGLATKIIVYDHNADRTDYPLAILADNAAGAYIDGSAFHLYGGDINSLNAVHTAYPNKNLYFTEQYTPTNGGFAGDLGWHITNLIVGATRNWCRNVIEWNLATDANFGPHTTGGCTVCKGALTIGQDVTRNVSYYIIAHASKFVRPGAVRIASATVAGLPNVAFKNTDGSKVLIVLNSTNTLQTFSIAFNKKWLTSSLSAGSVATFKW